MHLSLFFSSYYAWLDERAGELTRHLSVERLRFFIQQVTLVLGCEHDILRPGLLVSLLGDTNQDLRARLCDDERRVDLEQKLSRLPRASSGEIFCFEMRLVRDALSLAGLRAESWALFAEAVLPADEVERLEGLIGRCHDRCAMLASTTQLVTRVEVLH